MDASLILRILKDQIDQRGFINLKNLVFITEAATQADLFYREFRDFKFHILWCISDQPSFSTKERS